MQRKAGYSGLEMRATARMVAAALVMAVALGAALAVYFRLMGSPLIDTVALWTAQSTAFVLEKLGAGVSAYGTIVSSGSFAYSVVAECTALGPAILFAGAVVAYPSGLKAKGLGILLGVGALALVNLIRLVSLFYIGLAFPQYLAVAHYLVWQSLIILAAILLWLLWVGRCGHVSHR